MKPEQYLCQEILRYTIRQISNAANMYDLADVAIEDLQKQDQFKLERMLAWLRFCFGWKEEK